MFIKLEEPIKLIINASYNTLIKPSFYIKLSVLILFIMNIKLFNFSKINIIQIREYGYEYFQGDCNDMINDIHTLIKLPRLQNVVIENVK